MAENRHALAAAALACALLLTGCAGSGGVTPVRTHFNKGVYFYSRGDYPQAVREYRLATGQNSGDDQSRFNLAMSLEALAEETPAERAELRAQARAEYEELLRRSPGDVRCGVNLAVHLREEGEMQRAAELLQAAINANPRSALPRYTLASVRLDEMGFDEAEGLLREAVRLEPASVEALSLLAWTRELQGEFDDARAWYRRALEAAPGDIGVLYELGRVELASGRPRAAATALRQLLFLDEDHRRGHLALAEALEELDDLEGATHHLWRARSLSRARGGAAEREYSEKLLILYRRLIDRETAPAPATPGGA